MKAQKKVTNERAFEYVIAIAFPLINIPQQT
jgi:hypothetical protein